jgi:hypothetical protein
VDGVAKEVIIVEVAPNSKKKFVTIPMAFGPNEKKLKMQTRPKGNVAIAPLQVIQSALVKS